MSYFSAMSLPGVTIALTLAVGAGCPSNNGGTNTSTPTPTPTPTPTLTDTAADLFDNNTLHDMHVTVNPTDLAQLRLHFGENTYYPADLSWRNTVLHGVSIRSRGFSSRDPNKLGLYIDMNRDTPGQTFVGLKALVLDNLRQDPAMLREVMAMTLFARMGQTAPRASFCRLFLNNEYEGLYAMVENIDKTYLGRAFGRDDGYLFEHHWLQRFDGEYLGSDLAAYRVMLEARTHSNESDVTLYEPIRAMFEAINAPEEVKRRGDVEALVDLDQFVRVLAIEKTMTEADGLAGYFGMNNFYLHRDLDSGRHSFLVWDRDRSFAPDLLFASIFYDVYGNAVARRALGYEDLFALYLQVAEDTARTMSRDGWLSSELERLWAPIRLAAYADVHKGYSNEEVDAAVELLRQMVKDRPEIVLNEIGTVRAGAHGVR